MVHCSTAECWKPDFAGAETTTSWEMRQWPVLQKETRSQFLGVTIVCMSLPFTCIPAVSTFGSEAWEANMIMLCFIIRVRQTIEQPAGSMFFRHPDVQASSGALICVNSCFFAERTFCMLVFRLTGCPHQNWPHPPCDRNGCLCCPFKASWLGLGS